MASEHKLIIRTAAGVKVAEVSDYLWLSYTREVNAPGLLRFGLNGDHAAIGLLEDKGQIDVYRRNVEMGMPWTCELTALFRAQKQTFTDRPGFEATGTGILTKLSWRIVAWAAGTANRSEFVGAKAETIMKALVSSNAGANATTANGRKRNGTMPGIAVEADGAGGNTIGHWGCAWDNLLETLQGVAAIGGGDFDLVRTGNNAFEFRWYAGQRGTDRHNTVKFAVNLGNMERPEYEDDRMDEATVAIVGGQGEGSARAVEIRTGANYAETNDIELFLNGSGYTSAAGLRTAGDEALAEARAKATFGFKPLQTPATFYGMHYFLGDLVSARHEAASGTFKVQAVTIENKPGANEVVSVELQVV